MPLLLSKPISKHSAYAVWNIQETNDVLLKLIENQCPNNLRPTRLAEWIVGRVLIESLCLHLNVPYKGVAVASSGKPHLIDSDVEISISHSFPMAAALINLKSPCGIDLERARPKLVDIQEKFINEKELQYRNNIDKLCAIWCGKEVLYKIYGRKKLSMKDETTIIFEQSDIMTGVIHKDNTELKYRIHYEALKNYYLAYSL